MLDDERIAATIRGLENRISQLEAKQISERIVFPLLSATDRVEISDVASLTVNSDGPVVSTDGYSNVDGDSATFYGFLDDLGASTSVDCDFQYRQVGTTTFSDTSDLTLSSSASFNATATGLKADTKYEFRARGVGSNGDTGFGSLLKFKTDSGGVKIIDDFDDTNLTEYSGDTTDYGFTNSPAVSGAALEGLTDDGVFHSIGSTSGLANYPGRGDQAEINVRYGPTANDVHISALGGGLPEGHDVRIIPALDKLRVAVESRRVIDKDVSFSNYADEWLTLRLNLNAEVIHIEIFDSGNNLITEVAYRYATGSSGEITYAYKNTPVYLDEYIITGNTPTTIGGGDGFNDGDIAEYGGDTGRFTTTTSVTFEGSHALEGTGTGSNAAISDTGKTVSQGDVINNWIRLEDSSAAGGVYFGTQNENGASNISGYRVMVDYNQPEISAYKKNTGTETKLGQTSLSNAPTGTWRKQEIQWKTSDTIEYTLYEPGGAVVASLSVSDPDFSSGGLGFNIFDGPIYYDGTHWY